LIISFTPITNDVPQGTAPLGTGELEHLRPSHHVIERETRERVNAPGLPAPPLSRPERFVETIASAHATAVGAGRR
jgi:hypothetical protein